MSLVEGLLKHWDNWKPESLLYFKLTHEPLVQDS